MKRMHLTVTVCGLLLALTAGHPAWANVFDMGGTRDPATGQWTGLASLETVPVGNAGNAGELSGAGAGGFGPDRICGSVNYAYRTGRYEVTAGQYCEFLNAVAQSDTHGLYNLFMDYDAYPMFKGSNIKRTGVSGSYHYSIASNWANRPVNYVSFGDACRFSNWLHNGQPTGAQNAGTTEDGAYAINGATSDEALLAVTRKSGWTWAVASEDEWYKAAYYSPGTSSYYDYATSSNSVPGRDLNDASGDNANYDGTPYPIQSPYWTTVVGEFQNSESPYGTFDQSGNLWEWNEAVIDSYRGARGGSYFNVASDQLASARSCTSPTVEGYIGFRVVQVPEPATLALLALGSLLLARRRRA